jgi:phosphatidylglycerol lysyltransferase
MTVAGIGYGVWSLFRPILYRFRTLPQEHERAKKILDRHGNASLDFFKLWPDKSYFFNSSNDAFIAYRVGLNFAIALADPVGPETKIEETIDQFRQYCEDNSWGLAFHQTKPDFLLAYRRLGFKKLKIGDEAIVDLTKFTLRGNAMKRMRYKTNHFDKAGFHVKRYEGPLSEELLRRLREVSDEWLRIQGRRERTFCLGMFEPRYLRSTAVMTAEDEEGYIQAFANFIPSYRRAEATVDLMRYRLDAPNGIMDYLFIKLFLDCRERGFKRFSLGMAPLDGFRGHEESSVAEMTVYSFLHRMNFIFSFSGIKQFKAKYADLWEPRYLIYLHVFDLPKLGLALSRVTELGAAARFGNFGMQPWLSQAVDLSAWEIISPISESR